MRTVEQQSLNCTNKPSSNKLNDYYVRKICLPMVPNFFLVWLRTIIITITFIHSLYFSDTLKIIACDKKINEEIAKVIENIARKLLIFQCYCNV